MARWPDGPMARWPDGPRARWPDGPMARWPKGPMAQGLEGTAAPTLGTTSGRSISRLTQEKVDMIDFIVDVLFRLLVAAGCLLLAAAAIHWCQGTP